MAVLILALALAACGGSEEPTATPEPPPPTETVAEPAAEVEPTDAPEATDEPTAVPTEEPEPTEEPAPALDLQTFDSDEAGLSMSYPADWVSDTTFPDFLQFASSQKALEAAEPGTTDGAALLLTGPTEEFETDNPVAAMEQLIAELALEDAGLRGEITETTIHGNPAATALVDRTSESGDALTAYLAVIIDGEWAAIFVGTSPTALEDDYLDTFAAMAESIEMREPIMAEEPSDMASLLDSKGFLLYGDSVDASLSEEGQDTWDFIGLKGELVDIMVTPADDLDVTVDILDSSGTSVLDFPVDNSFGAEELIGFEVPADGTFFILVQRFDGDGSDYTLTLAESGGLPLADDPGSDEMGESGDAIPSDATPIEPGSMLELSGIFVSFTSGAEPATYTFPGKAGEFADVSVFPLTEELDVTVDVLSPAGTSLLEAPLDDSFDAEYIRVLPMPEDGEYTVVVNSYDGSAGDFEILVEESYLSQPASFIFASNSLEEADEVHEFPFYTYTDELVIIQVDPELDLDAVIQVYNDDTGEMLQEEDASTGFEEIVFFVPEDGNYSFHVLGYEGSTGSYDVTLIGSEFVYFELAVGDLVNGRFGENSLFEYYIGGAAGDTVSFTAKTNDNIDLILRLVDFDGNVLAEADDGFTGEQETLSYTFTEDALFILQVSDFTESGSGEFILSVD